MKFEGNLWTRGCTPWRPAVDMGTAWHENHTTSHRTMQETCCFTGTTSLSQGEPLLLSEKFDNDDRPMDQHSDTRVIVILLTPMSFRHRYK